MVMYIYIYHGIGKKKYTNHSPQFVGTEGRHTTNQPTNNFKVDFNRESFWTPNQRMLRDGKVSRSREMVMKNQWLSYLDNLTYKWGVFPWGYIITNPDP